MLTSSGGGRSMLTVADRGEGGGIKFAKILLTSYVNAPLGVVRILRNQFLAFCTTHFLSVIKDPTPPDSNST